MTPRERIDQFFRDLEGILALHDGEVMDVYDAVAAGVPTAQSAGDLLVALVLEEQERRRAGGRGLITLHDLCTGEAIDGLPAGGDGK